MNPAHQDFRRRLLRWYDQNRRDLPWRVQRGQGKSPDPYHVLVSEIMLQQTRASTVIPYYLRFLKRFPTPGHLAIAPEQEVLKLWQGLGYYSRARNLQAAAVAMMRDHNGAVPSQPEMLQTLPGIGRYTAGAIASLAFGQAAPVLDGNVIRVLCRLDGIRSDPRERRTSTYLWRRAGELVPNRRPGDFNSAMMELGATICVPRNPDCQMCPVRKHCKAAMSGLQDTIPLSRARGAIPKVRRYTYCVRHRNQWLIEQRPSRGRWPAMWQFLTLSSPRVAELPVHIRRFERIGQVRHALTHRHYVFEVFFAEATELTQAQSPRKWVSLRQLERFPLPRPHEKIAQMLRELESERKAKRLNATLKGQRQSL